MSVELPPDATAVGLAANVNVGAVGGGDDCTVTVVDALLLPEAFEHVSTNVVFAVIAGVACDPESALFPAQPPEAVHEVAFELDHVSVLV